MSIMVGMGRGAGAGILFRNAEALERLEHVDVLVMDKTGTLTEGRPSLVAREALPGVDESDLLRLVAALEIASEHPLANAVLAAARERGLDWPKAGEFESITGQAITPVRSAWRSRSCMLGCCRQATNIVGTP